MTPFTFDDEMHLLEHGYEYTPGTGWTEERKDKLHSIHAITMKKCSQFGQETNYIAFLAVAMSVCTHQVVAMIIPQKM